MQLWIGILLAAYGAGLLVGSRKFMAFFGLFSNSPTDAAPKQSPDGSRIVVIPGKALTFGASLPWLSLQ